MRRNTLRYCIYAGWAEKFTLTLTPYTCVYLRDPIYLRAARSVAAVQDQGLAELPPAAIAATREPSSPLSSQNMTPLRPWVAM